MQAMSLRTRFLLFALACLLPLAAVLGYYLYRDLDQHTQQVTEVETTTASAVSRSITSYLATNTDALEAIAQVDSVIALDREQAALVLGQAKSFRPELSSIFLMDTEQEIVASTSADAENLLASISQQFDQTLAQNTITVSQLIFLDSETAVVLLMVPVTTIQPTDTTAPADATDDPPASDVVSTDPTPSPSAENNQETQSQPPGRTTGVVAGVIQVDRLSAAVLPTNRGSAEIAVTNLSTILFATGGIDRSASTMVADHQESITLAVEGDVAPFSLSTMAGQERSAVAAPVSFEYAPWAVVVTHPKPGMFDGVSGGEMATVLALCIVAILALAVVLGELTARPIRILSRQARELHQGTLREPIVPIGTGEVRQLAMRFAEMANQIDTQVAGLEENRHDRERQAAQMRDLLRRTNRLQEDERRRIAAEIHDAVSPLITGALYQARALQMSNGSTPSEELDSALQSVSDLLEQAGSELHGVIFELRPPDLDDIGIVAAIEAYVHTIQRTGLSCRLEVLGPSPTLTPEVRLGLYRIAQEALHNVVRHAGADEAVVRLETTDEVVRLTIRDNGAGFDPSQAVQPTSLGLLSMHERAESIGATFAIVSKPGGGTAIVIERPNSGDVMSDEVLESMMLLSNGAAHHEQESVPDEAAPPVELPTSEPIR